MGIIQVCCGISPSSAYNSIRFSTWAKSNLRTAISWAQKACGHICKDKTKGQSSCVFDLCLCQAVAKITLCHNIYCPLSIHNWQFPLQHMQRIVSCHALSSLTPTLTLQIFSCAASSSHPWKDQRLSDFWSALADATEKSIGSATFLELEGGIDFPYEGDVSYKILIRDSYRVFAEQATAYCEQLVDIPYPDGVRRKRIGSPVFILRGFPGE